MVKFHSLERTKLTNGQHFSFMEAFVGDLKKIEDAPEKLQKAIDTMALAVAEEDKYLKISQGSYLTEEITAADNTRDNAYSKFRDMVKLWMGMEMEPQTTAAKALEKILTTYKINVRAQLDDESGIMKNFLNDISTEAMAKNVEAIGAKDIVAKMTEANNKVIDLLKQRDEEKSAKAAGAMRAARNNSDKAYAYAVEAIEAFNFVVGGFDDVITKWNGTIARYQDMLNRKSGTTGGSKPSTGGEEPDLPTIGGEPGDGGGSTGGGDDSGSGEIPDLPTIGGEPGDGGGSGGDTGGDSFEE